jgi:DeoR/GlpR family transcriptional regulator of sugar metabolism
MKQSLSPYNRQMEILKRLRARGECSVEMLAEEFDVSGMTVRRDLQELAREGKVTRTHGGAAPSSQVSFQFGFLRRMNELQPQKQAIADLAAGLVTDGQSILLDSGTTTLALARQLKARRGITVITTSLPIAAELFACEGVEILLLGGLLRHDSPDLTGAVTEANLETLHADIAFLGADAVDAEGNAYNASPQLARMLGKMNSASERTCVVADCTKLARRALVRYATAEDYDTLITDDGADPRVIATLEQHGIHVLEPQPEPARSFAP